jgi:zinc protease
MLYNISNYNYADDYAKQQEKIVKNSIANKAISK